MKKSKLLFIVFCVAASMVIPAGATVLLDEDFEGYSTGQQADTPKTPPKLYLGYGTGNLTGHLAPNGEIWASKFKGNADVVASGGKPGKALGHTSTTDAHNRSSLPLGTTVTKYSKENIIKFSVDFKLGDFAQADSNNCDLAIYGKQDSFDVSLQKVTKGKKSHARVSLGRLMINGKYVNNGIALLVNTKVKGHAWVRIWGQIDLGANKIKVGFYDGSTRKQVSYTNPAIGKMSFDSIWVGPEVKPAKLGDNGTRIDNLRIEAISKKRSIATASRKKAKRAKEMGINFGDGSQWKCLGGQWTGNGSAIAPPNKFNLPSRAFFIGKAFSDFTAEFEYKTNYRNQGQGDAGMILRAQDGNHFYYVRFPWGAQSLRAKNFWGGIAKVSGDGYLRNMVYENVRGVPSENDRWYKVKVEARGPRIRVWVDGRFAFEATDDSYKSGFIGFAGHGWYFFRNLTVNGTEVTPPAWDKSATIVRPAVELPIPSKPMASACIAPNGDVLVGAGSVLLRSTDKGRTWTKESFPAKAGKVGDYGNTMFTTRDGRLLIVTWRSRKAAKKPTPAISIMESLDNGKTWSDPVPSVVEEGWPSEVDQLLQYGPICETQDGTFLRFLYGVIKDTGQPRDIWGWGYYNRKAYCTRSTDGGKTWSGAIDLDWPTAPSGGGRGKLSGARDFTEPTGVAIGNTVMVTIRPRYSREMWQCWSYDAGKTWDASARTTFHGYAQSMIRTKSGVILCAHRTPNYTVNISRDNGLNWDAGTTIDYPVWAMGCMVEVEPDVVLCIYMNAILGDLRDTPSANMLMQRIRITTDGIVPLDPKK